MLTKIAWVEKGGDKNSLAERKGGDKEKNYNNFIYWLSTNISHEKKKRKKIVRWLLNKYQIFEAIESRRQEKL